MTRVVWIGEKDKLLAAKTISSADVERSIPTSVLAANVELSKRKTVEAGLRAIYSCKEELRHSKDYRVFSRSSGDVSEKIIKNREYV